MGVLGQRPLGELFPRRKQPIRWIFHQMASRTVELSRLSDDLLIRILAMASSWPHSRVQLTCARFSRLLPDFRRIAVEAFGIDETLMILAVGGHGTWQ